MANDEQIALLKKGAVVWNAWRDENRDIYYPDLSEANLSGAKLRRAMLFLANLRNANLSGADLSEAILIDAKLGGANLREANLSGVALAKADLRDANLSWADLSGANRIEATNLISGATNLSGADLSGADLHGADLRGADLTRANLGEALRFGASPDGMSDVRYAQHREANLNEANLSEAKLSGANLVGATLWNADLSGANLSGANLVEPKLFRANLSGAHLYGANLSRASLNEANLRGARLEAAQLVGTDFTGADLTGCRIYGVSAWDLKLEGAKQQSLVITDNFEPEITVDNIEVAQFIYLLLHNEKIRDVIDTIGKKGVLLLGRFTEGRIKILESLREKLRSLGFVPMVFNFDKPETKDFTETVRLLANLSHFVIVDITNPRSTPLELQAAVPDYMIPFAPIVQEGEEPFAMFKDLQNRYDWVLPIQRYSSIERLIEGLEDKIVRHAEAKFNELLARRTKQLRVEKM